MWRRSHLPAPASGRAVCAVYISKFGAERCFHEDLCNPDGQRWPSASPRSAVSTTRPGAAEEGAAPPLFQLRQRRRAARMRPPRGAVGVRGLLQARRPVPAGCDANAAPPGAVGEMAAGPPC